jgi:hypothetical protein
VFTAAFKGIASWAGRVEWITRLQTLKAQYAQYNIAYFAEILFPIDLVAYTHSQMTTGTGEVGLSVHMFVSYSHAQALLSTAALVFVFTWEIRMGSNLLLFWTFTLFMAINVTVGGWLMIWNCDIDAITMVGRGSVRSDNVQVTMSMSIGFSIDYMVHMSHHLAKYDPLDEDPSNHIMYCLQVRRP